jgi:flagellar M-ring protein FliF
MSPYIKQISQFFRHLSGGQRVALALVFLGGIGLLGTIMYVAGKPDYTLLFGRMDPTDASKVVEALRSQGVRYEIRENGTAVFVPREEVYELRLRFAGEGLVSDGPSGYELFDRGTLGMTDFMQKLNLKRALEGELARTISSIRQVELCRVHLVIPERSPFRETQSQPSASVVLQLSGSARLAAEQIEGIAALVAGAVEGLPPSGVTVLDTRGNMLSNPEARNPDAMASSNQLRMQRAVEVHLTEKGQTMLDQVLGAGNAIVRVTAALDFSRSVAEREVIDPESATVISEERLEEQGGTDTANSTVRNYELSRTRERSEKSVGDVSYITVSVILNYKRPAAITPERSDAAPYAAEEIAEIESLVKNAVGFNPERGDRLAIHQTRFDTAVDERIADEMRELRESEQIQIYMRYGLMILALAVAAWLLRSASRRLTTVAVPGALTSPGKDARRLSTGTTRPGLSGGGALELTEGEELVLVDDVYTSKLSPDARKRLKAKHLMFEEIKHQVAERPAETAELLRTWMIDDLRAH